MHLLNGCKVGAQTKAAIKAKTMETEVTITSEQLDTLAIKMANVIADRVAINSKPVLTFKEACIYTGLSMSALYKQTMLGNVPHYKPNGKMVYFNREELDGWLLQNRCSTQAELDDIAQTYTNRKGA